MTTRTSSFIKSDSQLYRIGKQMGGGGGLRECRVRDVDLKRRGFLSEAQTAVRMNTEPNRNNHLLCMCSSPTQFLHAEGLKHSNTGPCTDHSEELHINYVMVISH